MLRLVSGRAALLAAALWVASAVPAPAQAGAAAHPSAGDKCPVCGMFVAKYPDWVASVTFKDGGVAWFDGAKDLFKFLQQPERFLHARRAAEVARVTVTDYYAVKPIDARAAWFVIGGDVYGPMGVELVPFLEERDAREFLADHKGKGLLRFGEVGPATLRQLGESE